MGSQLGDLSSSRTVVTSRVLTAHQLAGTGSDKISYTSMGTSVVQSDCSRILRQQHGSCAHLPTRGNSFHLSVQEYIGIISPLGSVCDLSHSHPSSQSPECDSGGPVSDQQSQPYGVVASRGNPTQSVLCLGDPSSGHVRHRGEQGDPSLHFTLPGRQGLGGKCPLHILGRLRPNLCLPTSSNSPPNPPKDQVFTWHHSDPHRFSTPVLAMAPSATSAQPSSSHTADRCSPVPVHPQHSPPSVPQRPSPVGSSHVVLIQDLLRQQHNPERVVEMAADPLGDSSSNVNNSQLKAFAKWANYKGIQSKDLSCVRLVEYLVHLFAENKQVKTIKVHWSSIASVLRMLNPPTAIQEDTIHNIIRRMSILHPQEILPKWHISVVLKGLMKPPFAINRSDKNISLELLSYNTAFLVALATGTRGSELVALTRAAHNLDFTLLESGAKHASIRLVPKFSPKNQCPDLIPKTLEFPGIAHLFLQELERLLCVLFGH